MNVDLIFRHEDFRPEDGRGRVAVVIDILRATTSITTAIMNGASSVIPVMTPEEGFTLRESYGYLLAGERNGLRIDGYDFGNSPLEFSNKNVHGKTLVMSTSNGTKSLVKASVSDKVIVASFLNAPHVAKYIKTLHLDVILLCGGTIGEFSLEDTVCGGMIAALLDGNNSKNTQKAIRHYRDYQDDLLRCFHDSFHGTHLTTLGYEDDLAYAAQVGITEVIPFLDENGRITGLDTE